MPRCKNSPDVYYTGKENTPLGRGYSSRGEKEGQKRKGKNGEMYQIKNGRWSKISGKRKNKNPKGFFEKTINSIVLRKKDERILEVEVANLGGMYDGFHIKEILETSWQVDVSTVEGSQCFFVVTVEVTRKKGTEKWLFDLGQIVHRDTCDFKANFAEAFKKEKGKYNSHSEDLDDQLSYFALLGLYWEYKPGKHTSSTSRGRRGEEYDAPDYYDNDYHDEDL